ncbi:MAG: methyltransferase domain-containing protein [Candidatus Binatia bacterium]
MRRSTEPEMMDLPDQPRELLTEDLRNLRLINRYLGCHRNVLRGLARLVSSKKLRAFTLLDVGTGSADIPEVIVRWARRKHVTARIAALERDPVSVEEAAEQTLKLPEVTVIRGDGIAPPFNAASFDFILASQLLHHFSDSQIIAALRTWARLARCAIIVNDLVRHPLAYHGIRLVTKTFTRNEMTRTDAPRSVERACTISEWRELFRRANIGTFSVQRTLPFRVLGVISINR